MFALLRRWFLRDRRRCIFRYHDGTTAVYADPLAAARRLEQAGGENWLDVVRAVDAFRKPPQPGWSPGLLAARRQQKDKAVADLTAMARAAFGLTPLTPAGAGTTDAEAVGVLMEYLTFMAKLGERARPQP